MQAYRKELKFYCSDADLVDIENCIKTVMKRDDHQDGSFYNIRSIYFDDPFDICFLENAAGVGVRNKYRIRIYNCQNQLIRAEIKSRYRDTISKSSALLSMTQYESIMNRRNLHLLAGKGEVYEQYLEKILSEAYRPVSIVEYERKAFVYQPCNVRITFDRNIVVSTNYDRFFDENMKSIPMLPKGVHVLEIKYDEFLPDFIGELLQGKQLKRVSCSKYYLSRQILGRMYK